MSVISDIISVEPKEDSIESTDSTPKKLRAESPINESREVEIIDTSDTNDSPAQILDLKGDMTAVDEDAIDLSKWNFYKAGGAKRNSIGVIKQSFNCGSFKQTNCQVKIYLNYVPEGPLKTWNMKKHNHAPPNKVKVDKDLLRAHTKDINELQTAANSLKKKLGGSQINPNLSPISPSKPKEKGPEGLHFDFISKIQQYTDFVKEVTIFPGIRIILMADEALEYLKTSQTIFLDSTFDMIDNKLYLTTLYATVSDFVAPLGFFLYNQKSQENHEHFLKFLKSRTNDLLTPSQIIGDYDIPLREACYNVFPSSHFCGDPFFLFQANEKWLKQNQGAEFVAEALEHLKLLYHAKSFDDFMNQYSKFYNHWKCKFLKFVAYFEQTWINFLHPSNWVEYCRTSDLSADCAPLEELHSQIRSFFGGSLESGVDSAYKEWLNYEKVLGNPFLLEQKKTEMQCLRENTRKNESLSPTNSDESSEVDRKNSSKEIPLKRGEEMGNQHVESLSSGGVTEANTLSVQPNQSPLEEPPLCRNCHTSKINKKCSLHMCQTCCSKFPTPCTISIHSNLKLSNKRNVGFISQVDEAIHKQTVLWLKYNYGKGVEKVTCIKPQKWNIHGQSFDGMCISSGIIKKYFVTRCLDVRFSCFED